MSNEIEKTKIVKKRKVPWLLGSFVLLLLVCLFLLQSSNVWKNIAVDSASETLILYALSSLNFIAFIIFAFILIRSLLKLRQERRALQLGSKIKTRLVIYFAAVTLLPLIAMAVFSYWFMNRAVQNWFTEIPKNTVRKVGLLQEKTNKEQIDKFNKIAPMLATILDKSNVNNNDLQEIVDKGDLIRLEIISADKNIIAKGEKSLSEKQKTRIDKVLSDYYNSKSENIKRFVKNGLDVVSVQMSEGKTLVMISDVSSTENLQEITEQALDEFDNLKSQQVFVRQIGITTLGLLTFLLIFASSWTAFYVAKGLTRPIKALAEGADEIAKGNFAHRVNIFAEDELELLVHSFNVMSGKLQENSVQLEERQKYIETVLQSLSTGVISFDEKNRLSTINKAAVKMFNLEEADFTNFELKQLVNKENAEILEKLISRATRIGQATEQTVLQREYNNGSAELGESLPVALAATALPDKSGVVVVIEDLTELITAQRASAWQEVARRMAHEIKNPLTPIQLSAERIAKRCSSQFSVITHQTDGGELSESGKTQKIIKDGTQTILREVSSLKSMVDEFSRYARLPNITLEEGDINEIIIRSMILYEDRIDDVTIKSDLAENLPKILVDEEQLKRVFVNLIDNSFEAFEDTNDDKTIVIKTINDTARDLIVIEVSDNGKGVNPRDMQRLFQPYFSTKGRGTGLGLAIVQRIITEHGGKIKVVANNPTGAKFIIELNTND